MSLVKPLLEAKIAQRTRLPHELMAEQALCVSIAAEESMSITTMFDPAIQQLITKLVELGGKNTANALDQVIEGVQKDLDELKARRDAFVRACTPKG